ncbi:hypothetical protein AB0K08_14025 [Citricoccus sp. NPDC055426]|uniref:hypothetical protein n=1 Tax=Citricoccus sp. NPDC055426 TaxID=3155536 RepID=UPI00344725AA
MSENHPKSPSPRLGTPQIKTGGRRPTNQPDRSAELAEPAEAAEAALPTRRSLRQHRRADSEAGTPAGKASRAAILELPATTISPSDVGPLTGQLPTGMFSTRGGTDRGEAIQSGTSPSPAVRVDHDGVPVGPDGHPLTRRELRAWQRRQEEAPEGAAPEPSDVPAAPAAAGPQSSSRRAEAPAGSPGTVAAAPAPAGGPTSAEVPTRESLAAEGAALAARIEESGGADPSAVDPVLLREQELLAERARQLNTGLIARVPVAAPAPAPAGDSTPAPGVSAAPAASAAPAVPAAAQEPVQARSAHGLDSLGASAWSSRERNLILAAGLVIAALLIALILALVL